MKRLPLLPILTGSMLAAPLSQAASIGWNFLGTGGVGLATTDVAGASGFEQGNWNNHAGAGQGPGSVPLNDLVDDSGTATTIDVTDWTMVKNNSWRHEQTGSPDQILMNDFNNTEPTLSFDQIPYSNYNLVVYYGNNEGPSTSTLFAGGLARVITTGNTASSSFGTVGYLEGTDLNTATPTNFTVFTGLTSSSLDVGLTGDNNNGISAIQFVQVPEPTSAGLLGFALLATMIRRRK